MKLIKHPPKEDWEQILKRPASQYENMDEICRPIFNDVQNNGDAAVMKYSQLFDNIMPECFSVTEEEFEMAEQEVSQELKDAILLAKDNIEQFHILQLPEKVEYINENGFRCWQEARPIERVGLYIPGGSAPLFSTVLMLAIPANLAGCKNITLCTPPLRDGKIHPAILWTARLCGVTTVFKVGGIQAIAAMTFGTESISCVDKIFGPGNQFVTMAKQWATRYGVAIDMPAGASELMIVADETANPAFVAADLLSQAEHGADSQVVLITCNNELPEKVAKEVEKQLIQLPRRETAEKSLSNSMAIVLKTKKECIEMINLYAPEHLMLSVDDYMNWIPEIHHAGSVFLGNYSPESAGDYASGTNHTLPTSGYARTYSGVGIDSFMKKISFQEITREGLNYLGKAIMIMAENEQLTAHGKAVEVRIRN